MTTCPAGEPAPLHAAPVAVAPALKLIHPVYVEPLQQPLLPWSQREPEPLLPAAEVDARVRVAAARLAGAIVEVLRGRRPHLHLAPYLTEPVLELVCALALSDDRHDLRVAGVRVATPTDEVAEAAIRLRHGSRSSAMALRLERAGDRWRAVALEVAFDRRIVRAAAG